MKKKLIKPILYERIEQKKEIERELFSKLTPKEKRAAAKAWTEFIDGVAKQGEAAQSAEIKVKKKSKRKE